MHGIQRVHPKSAGKGLMVSGFVTMEDGWIRLTREEFQQAVEATTNGVPTYPHLVKYKDWVPAGPETHQETWLITDNDHIYGIACHDYSTSKSYWTSEKMMVHASIVADMVRFIFKHRAPYNSANITPKVTFFFDNSRVHTAMAEDALTAVGMTVGEQKDRERVHAVKDMRTGWYRKADMKNLRKKIAPIVSLNSTIPKADVTAELTEALKQWALTDKSQGKTTSQVMTLEDIMVRCSILLLSPINNRQDDGSQKFRGRGLQAILEERGLLVPADRKLNREQLSLILAHCPDFMDQKCALEEVCLLV